VVARGDQILSAMLSSTDGSGDGGTLVAYVSSTARWRAASAEVGDVTDEMAWTHTCTIAAASRSATRPSRTSPRSGSSHRAGAHGRAANHVYESPDKLPFYTAFKSARAGTLSARNRATSLAQRFQLGERRQA